jgi:hypothetical protein
MVIATGSLLLLWVRFNHDFKPEAWWPTRGLCLMPVTVRQQQPGGENGMVQRSREQLQHTITLNTGPRIGDTVKFQTERCRA